MASPSQTASGKPIKEKLPLIVLTGTPRDLFQFIENLKLLTGIEEIDDVPFWKTCKLRAQSREEHEKLVNCLKRNNWWHFTYPFKENKQRKFVIHNLPATLESEEILLDLKKTIPEILNVKQMVKKLENGEQVNLPVFILTASKSVTLKRFQLVKKICSHKYRIECYKANYSAIQCFKCHLYGHTMKYCNSINLCLRCAGFHSLKECTNTEIKCCNCGEQHVASYKKCSGRKNFEMKRGKQFESDAELAGLVDFPVSLF